MATMTDRDLETMAYRAIESAELTPEQKFTAWLLVLAQRHLAERPQTKPFESWSLEEILEFAKTIEDVRPLPR
jgi:hypothetical protein